MKRLVGVIVAFAAVAALAGAALAYGPGGGMRGSGMMGGGPGQSGCPGFTAASTTGQITEEKAKELATQYTEKYLPDFTVERVLPFTGMHHTMYSVELKGPKDEVRTLHINPWGNVIPFGTPVSRTQ